MLLCVCVCVCVHINTYIIFDIVIQSLSYVQLFCNPMDYSPPAKLPMGFHRQKYWSGLPFPSPGNLPDPGIEPKSPALQVDYLPTELPGKPREEALKEVQKCWNLLIGN